jgi:F-type H+-transporting ATPase subunit delta
MANSRAAKRYAEALMSAAEQQKILGRVTEDMQSLERVMNESKELVHFLKSPVIKKEKKRRILTELFGKQMHALTMSFIDLLAAKGREDILAEIGSQFFALRDERLGIVGVEIQAADQLSKDQHEKIQKQFEGITRKKVRLAFSIDKQLKGGFLAKVGDTVFDGTVKRQLELLRKRFEEGVGSN